MFGENKKGTKTLATEGKNQRIVLSFMGLLISIYVTVASYRFWNSMKNYFDIIVKSFVVIPAVAVVWFCPPGGLTYAVIA